VVNTGKVAYRLIGEVLEFSMATAGLTSPWATDSRSDRKASGLVTGGEWGNGVIYYLFCYFKFILIPKRCPERARAEYFTPWTRSRTAAKDSGATK